MIDATLQGFDLAVEELPAHGLKVLHIVSKDGTETTPSSLHLRIPLPIAVAKTIGEDLARAQIATYTEMPNGGGPDARR